LRVERRGTKQKRGGGELQDGSAGRHGGIILCGLCGCDPLALWGPIGQNAAA